MAFTHFKTAEGSTSSATLTYTLGVGESIPAGATIHVAACAQGSETHSVSDSVNGAYTQDKDELQAGAPIHRSSLHRFSNNSALGEADTITVTYSAASLNRSMLIGYSDDLDLSSPLDQAATSADGSSTTPAAGSQTLNNANVRWIGAISTGNGNLDVDLNEDADFVSQATAAGTARSLHYATRDVAATETNDYTPTLDNATTWTALLAAYKKAAAPAAGRPNLTLLGVG